MGRGRAKAKQAKVARQLKYSGAGTDLEALRKELAGGSNASASAVDVDNGFDDEFDDTYDSDDDLDDEDDDVDDEDPDDDLGRTYGTGR
jgi:hypothetical protein